MWNTHWLIYPLDHTTESFCKSGAWVLVALQRLLTPHYPSFCRGYSQKTFEAYQTLRLMCTYLVAFPFCSSTDTVSITFICCHLNLVSHKSGKEFLLLLHVAMFHCAVCRHRLFIIGRVLSNQYTRCVVCAVYGSGFNAHEWILRRNILFPIVKDVLHDIHQVPPVRYGVVHGQ